MELNEGVALESLPHQLRICGGKVLVVVPGRAPICLRCRRTEHIRRDCRVPWCNQCRAFGHEATTCVKTYARATGNNSLETPDDLELMDEFEAENTASEATVMVPEASGEPVAANAVSGEVTPEPEAVAPTEKATHQVVEHVSHEKTEKPEGPQAPTKTDDDDGNAGVDEVAKAKDDDDAKAGGD
ncbi:unnamed protein product, partial [Ixodes hexagonus]